jgi:hypothetical protein
MRLVSESKQLEESVITDQMLKRPVDSRGTVEALAAAREQALLDSEYS